MKNERKQQIVFVALATLFCSALAIDCSSEARDRKRNSESQDQDSGQSSTQTSAGLIDRWHAPPVASADGIPELNLKVANFAVEHLGQQVGNGECWTLVAVALKESGGQPPQDYVFGRELRRGDAWLPGDIIQFSSCHFEETHPGGWSTFDLGSPNHTSIIHSAQGAKTVLLHQNIGDIRKVQTMTVDFNDLKSGSYKVYRPIPLDPTLDQESSRKKRARKRRRRDDSDSPNQVQGQPQNNASTVELAQVSAGPYQQERSILFERIRRLQTAGANVVFYMQRFQDLELRARDAATASDSQRAAAANGLSEEIGTLNQLLSIRESKMLPPAPER